MVELKETRKVRKLQNRYIFETKTVYPPKNVEEMLKAWKTKIALYNEFIEKYDEKLTQAISEADAEANTQIENLKKDYERFGNLDKEAQIAELFAVSDETRKQQQEIIENKEKNIEATKEYIKTNMSQMKAKAIQEMEELQNAIHLWTNTSQ